MYPITLNTDFVHFGLVGRGQRAARRARSLMVTQPKRLTVFSDEPSDQLRKVAARHLIERLPTEADLEQLRAICICDLREDEAESLVELAWKNKVLVNYEDKPGKSDFHVPGIVRRGDLLFTVSTAGQSPALTAALRGRIAEIFGPEWKDRLADVSNARKVWREGGAKAKDIRKMTNALIKEKDWLP